MITDFLRGTRDLVYPNICVICDSLHVDSTLEFCPNCVHILTHDPHPTCPRCSSTIADFADVSAGCPNCWDDHLHFDSVFRMGPYEGSLRDIILRMKHHQGESLAESVGLLWTHQQASQFLELGADCVVPVPLHWWRRLHRGYNQSEVLSAAVASSLNIPHLRSALNRVRATPSQIHQTAAGRRTNVKGAFQTTRPTKLTGRKVLLVDDVMTTGSTASEAARALKKSGAQVVHVAVLAHQ